MLLMITPKVLQHLEALTQKASLLLELHGGMLAFGTYLAVAAGVQENPWPKEVF